MLIHRPLVFGTDTPAVMVSREQIDRMHDFFAARQIFIHTCPFQQNYEIIRFPGLKHPDVEELLDQLIRAEETPHPLS